MLLNPSENPEVQPDKPTNFSPTSTTKSVSSSPQSTPPDYSLSLRQNQAIGRILNNLNSSSHPMISVPTTEFAEWFRTRRPYFNLERGFRIMHPQYVVLQWVSSLNSPRLSSSSKPKLMTHPFVLSFQEGATENIRRELSMKPKVAL